MSVAHNGEFSWKITDPAKVHAFLNAPPGRKFESAIFRIGAMDWQLYAYPQGKYRKDPRHKAFIPGCELNLQLLTWPRKVSKIIFNYRLYCAKANSSYTDIVILNRNEKKYHEYTVNWYRGTLTAAELWALEGQQVELQCYINILKVIGVDHAIKYEFPYKLSTRRMQFQWRVNNIDELFVNTKCGKHLESEIYQHMWCLRVAPKGWKLRAQKNVTLWLQICCFPMNIGRLDCKWSVECVETKTRFTGVKEFHYKAFNYNAPWNQEALATSSLRRYDSLTFRCRVQILSLFDRYGVPVKIDDYLDESIVTERVVNTDDPLPNDAHRQPYPTPAGKQQIAPPAPVAVPPVVANHGYDEGEAKSSEEDGLHQEIEKLKKQVSEMQTMLLALRLKVGAQRHTDEQKENMSIFEMLEETQREVELLKAKQSANDIARRRSPVRAWLEKDVKLPQYYQMFHDNGFEDMNAVRLLNNESLEMLGVKKLGHRFQMLSAIKDLQENEHTFDADGNVQSTMGNTESVHVDCEGHNAKPGNSNYL